MSYLSKQTVLTAYKLLSTISEDYTLQGATQKVSAIRYLLATNAFYKKFDRPCDKNNNDDSQFYISEVGRVVSVNDKYSTNFAIPLKSNTDYAVGSNFFSVNVVKNSKLSPDSFFEFPQRSYPIIKVKAEKLYYDKSLLTNVDWYISADRHKFALMLWLSRNEIVDQNNIFESILSYLGRIYTDDLVEKISVDYETFKALQYSAIKIGYSNSKEDITDQDINDLFDKSKKVMGTIAAMSKRIDYNNTILYGPPGTGKTYAMQKIFTGYPEEHRTIVTFHQSYSYEEFIIGLKAKTEEGRIAYSYEKGVFYNACETAAQLAGYSSLAECCADTKEGRNAKFAAAAADKSRQFLFCIDEINRANISAVFGDLISLIEENKRLGAQNEMIVRLPYTQELFGVPANLRLLGTMNTADRSIQILDTALRRRFQFKEYLPDYSVLRSEKAKDILHAINDRIRALLGQDRQIGHSYFFDIEASAADESIRILKALANKIIPLLQEYFYNDVEKIRFVLGEKDRIPDEHSFYIEDGNATAAFSRYDSDSEETSFYILNTEGIASASMSNESASAFIEHLTA